MHFMPPQPQKKNLSPKYTPHCTMSADGNTPLFELDDEDDVTYEDDPTRLQARANLMAAERVQQEKVKQRRLEREQRWVERLRGEVEEVERKQRELEEVELRRLGEDKERLERERQIEEGGIGGTIPP